MNLIGVAAIALMGTVSHAAKSGLMNDPNVQKACHDVVTACEGANVKDEKTGKSGYEPGEWKEGTGLWANCIAPLARGKGKGYPVPGLTNPPTQQAAQTCVLAKNAFCANNAADPCHSKK